MGILLRWCQFIKERFNPLANTITIAAFFSANAAIAYMYYPSEFQRNNIAILTGFLLVWLIFFHMRLFDDIKDFEIDKLVNKERPLPRGLLNTTEYGFGILLCIITEIILACSLGWKILFSYILVLAFTLIMRLEFFIGDWLRPKMELYAVTHTLSASLTGLLIYSMSAGYAIFELPKVLFFLTLCNWFVFNVYEFGRKTFGVEEEREGVDSYSRRLKPVGAFLLLSSNMMLAFIIFFLSIKYISVTHILIKSQGINLLQILIGSITLTVAFFGIKYSFKPEKFFAQLYRNVVSLYLVLFYLTIPVITFIFFR